MLITDLEINNEVLALYGSTYDTFFLNVLYRNTSFYVAFTQTRTNWRFGVYYVQRNSDYTSDDAVRSFYSTLKRW